MTPVEAFIDEMPPDILRRVGTEISVVFASVFLLFFFLAARVQERFFLRLKVRNRKVEFARLRAARLGVPLWYVKVYCKQPIQHEDKDVPAIGGQQVAHRLIPCVVKLHRLNSGSPIPPCWELAVEKFNLSIPLRFITAEIEAETAHVRQTRKRKAKELGSDDSRPSSPKRTRNDGRRQRGSRLRTKQNKNGKQAVGSDLEGDEEESTSRQEKGKRSFLTRRRDGVSRLHDHVITFN